MEETDTYPPQLGIHYHVGFENAIYIDEFEGITSDYRGAFKWYSGNLYYRYATQSEFGVARVNASGTTTGLIDQAIGVYWNHLNFAFDIDTSNGDLFFVYASDNILDESTVWSGTITSTSFTSFFSTLTTFPFPRTIQVTISTDTFGTNRGPDSLRVTGTDANGNTKTETLTRTAGTQTVSQYFEGFMTITNIEGLAQFTNTTSGSVRVVETRTSSLEIKKRTSAGVENNRFDGYTRACRFDDT